VSVITQTLKTGEEQTGTQASQTRGEQAGTQASQTGGEQAGTQTRGEQAASEKCKCFLINHSQF